MTTAYADPRPISDSLQAPEIDKASLNDVLDNCGWGVQSVNWIFEQVTGESLVETIITPITGDWSKIRADGDAWRNVGNAMNDMSYNLTDAVGKLRDSWDGEAAKAHERYIALGWKAGLFAEMGVCQLIAKGFDTVAEGAEALGKQAARLLDYLVNKLIEAAATVWIPVAGWVKAAEMVWNAYQIYRRIMDIIDTVKKLITDVKALFDAVGRIASALGKLKDADSLADAMNATQEVAEGVRDVRNSVNDIKDDASSIKDSATEIGERGRDIGHNVRHAEKPHGGADGTSPSGGAHTPSGPAASAPPTVHGSSDGTAPSGGHTPSGPAASAPPTVHGSSGAPSGGAHTPSGPAAHTPPTVNHGDTTHASTTAAPAAPHTSSTPHPTTPHTPSTGPAPTGHVPTQGPAPSGRPTPSAGTPSAGTPRHAAPTGTPSPRPSTPSHTPSHAGSSHTPSHAGSSHTPTSGHTPSHTPSTGHPAAPGTHPSGSHTPTTPHPTPDHTPAPSHHDSTPPAGHDKPAHDATPRHEKPAHDSTPSSGHDKPAHDSAPRHEKPAHDATPSGGHHEKPAHDSTPSSGHDKPTHDSTPGHDKPAHDTTPSGDHDKQADHDTKTSGDHHDAPADDHAPHHEDTSADEHHDKHDAPSDDHTPKHEGDGDGGAPPADHPAPQHPHDPQFGADAIAANGESYHDALHRLLPDDAARAHYEELSKKYSHELTPAEAQHVADIRNQIPVNNDHIMTKALHPNAVNGYLNNNWDTVQGSVARGVDVQDIQTPAGLRDGLALDDSASAAAGKPWSPIQPGDDHAMQLRWVPGSNTGNMFVPYGGTTDPTSDAAAQQMAHAGGASSPTRMDAPFTGTGYTGGGVPEWQFGGRTPLGDRAEIWRVNADGTEALHAVYIKGVGWKQI